MSCHPAEDKHPVSKKREEEIIQRALTLNKWIKKKNNQHTYFCLTDWKNTVLKDGVVQSF